MKSDCVAFEFVDTYSPPITVVVEQLFAKFDISESLDNV